MRHGCVILHSSARFSYCCHGRTAVPARRRRGTLLAVLLLLLLLLLLCPAYPMPRSVQTLQVFRPSALKELQTDSRQSNAYLGRSLNVATLFSKSC